ncbi:heme-copper oxidase subunit III [Halobium palmae]|uniref:Heme-copper oxidase subunit III n=1 Tax=Halobium palmae TaxID=1776492 RepID=A0ABD5S342_9EURY
MQLGEGAGVEGHELPAGDDPPKGDEESTWWPILTAVGAGLFYLGAGLYLLGQGEIALLPPLLGQAVFVGGLATMLFGVCAWIYHGFVDEYWTYSFSDVVPRSHRMGMTLFLVTDVATFSGALVYYGFVRFGTWPPEEIPTLLGPELYANTFVLLASSFVLHGAHEALQAGHHRRFTAMLGSTACLGALFVAGQVHEYYDFVFEEGFTISRGLYGGAFYSVTGLHGLHVLLGTLMLGLLFVRALAGQYGPERDTSIETVSMYWHFVDAVWLVIVASIYVGATVGA